MASAGTELYRLIRQGRIEWRAELDARQLAAVREGQPARVEVPGRATVAGKVRLVFREFLTPPNEFAAAGFLLARRVPGKYFEVLTTVFQKREAIFESGRLWEGLLAIGQQYGLTEAQFTAAMNDTKALDGVNARFRRAIGEDQIQGTPTFFVNGAPYEGDADLAALSKIFALAAKG